MLARVRSLSSLECVGETLRAALNELAGQAPDWLVQQVSADWFDRYSHRVENYRLPKAESERKALAQQMGADGLHLLHALDAPGAPEGLAQMKQVQVLRRVWSQHYDVSEGKANWRGGPQADWEKEVVRSPSDGEADNGQKRDTHWLGYKVHLTETCDVQDAPHLIVDVQTTGASVTDWEMTAVIQKQLATRQLKPNEQLVDTGYVTAEHLVSGKPQGIQRDRAGDA